MLLLLVETSTSETASAVSTPMMYVPDVSMMTKITASVKTVSLLNSPVMSVSAGSSSTLTSNDNDQG